MKIRLLFIITAVLSLINGFFYLLFPDFSLALLGQSTNAIGLLNMRYFGAAALGIGVIAWLSRDIQLLRYQRITASGLLITLGASAVVGFLAGLGRSMNLMGWLMVGTDTLLSLGFILYLISPQNEK